MFKKLFILLLFVIGTIAAQASMHISESPDEDFVDLGNKFPSVGCIHKGKGKPGKYGSGTLINTGFPQLEGRVVISAAHVLEENTDQFIFSLNGEHRSGKIIIHPEYEEWEKLHPHYSRAPVDIGLFYLNKPIEAPSADLNFDLSYENCLGKYYTTVGYGLTGHIDGVNRIYDTQRRASWSFADPLINKYYLNSKDVLAIGPNQENDPSYLPVGVSSQGNSGGGIFTTDGKLVALVSSGEFPPENVTYLVANSCYQHSQFGFDEILKASEKEKDDFVFRFRSATYFTVMPDDDIDRYLMPRVAERDDQRILHQVFINYHQNWLQEKFAELAKLSN